MKVSEKIAEVERLKASGQIAVPMHPSARVTLTMGKVTVDMPHLLKEMVEIVIPPENGSKRVVLTMSKATYDIQQVMKEAAELMATRLVPKDVLAEIDGIQRDCDFLEQGEPTVVDDKLLIPCSPSSRLIAVLERLRECPAA